ncbi:MAG: C1 family peptidase, partial [Bacteroidota bacterium]
MKKTGLLVTALLVAPGLWAQHGSGDNTSAAEFEKILRSADRATRDLLNLPVSFSLKKYTPPPQNQGQYGTCVAWSSAYAARTISFAIQKNITNPDSIKKYVFSPGYLYYKIKATTDVNCSAGASILTAMQVMTSNGALLKNEGLVDCAASIPENMEQQKATPYKIKDFLSLNKTYDSITKNDILKIKKSLTEKKPVVISVKIGASFEKVSRTGVWSPVANQLVTEHHAMCVIGYDDKIGGGSFEVMNSWGPIWGNKGFFWLSYRQLMTYGSYIVELMDFETGKTVLSGDIEFIKVDEQNNETRMPVTRGRISADNINQDPRGNDYSLYKLTETYSAGTMFKMKFSTNTRSYIYVFAQDNTAALSRLFPPSPAISAAINSANATYYFPSDSTHARLDATAGKENFCILYSKSEIDFEGLMNYIKQTGVNIFKGVKDKLGDRLVDLKKVQFSD